ncbi:hypothetical protein BJ944DRAFT_244528 [Cunninghamella echinulata]|nr:hypothetical protein BJ944DRAFT_244528 [Cunninghamella echinulata]
MSLLEMHRQNKKGNKRKLEDDPRQRGFDRDKDLVSARPMSKKQKQELLQKSSEWSDRFGHSRGNPHIIPA